MVNGGAGSEIYGRLQKPDGKNLERTGKQHRHYQSQGAGKNVFPQNRVCVLLLVGQDKKNLSPAMREMTAEDYKATGKDRAVPGPRLPQQSCLLRPPRTR